MNRRRRLLDGLRLAGEHEPQDEGLQTALVLVYEFAFALPGFFVQFQDRADLAQSVVASLLAAPLTERKRWAPVYLRTCVRNEARKRWKRRNRAPFARDPEKLDALVDDSQHGGGASCPPGCGDGALSDCDQGARARFIQDLPPFQRRVLELRLADVSIHAIAAILERSRSQVQDALREVIRKLERIASEGQSAADDGADGDGPCE
jgi:DNA-directed RNA polymerase specialized sigma24 family protein